MSSAIRPASSAALAADQVEQVRDLIRAARTAETVFEAKKILDAGAALRVLLRRQDAAGEVQAEAVAIVEEAMRRAGELCLAMPTDPGRRSDKPRPAGETRLKAEVLKAEGIPRSTANRWEARARLSLKAFRVRLEGLQAKVRQQQGAGTTATTAEDFDRDGWGTPPELLAAAREVLGSIELDPASNAHAQRFVKAQRYNTRERSGLLNPWTAETLWLNPPYSKPLCGQFVQKFHDEADSVFGAGLLLVNAATDTGWAQPLLRKFPTCFLPRVAFLHPVTGEPCDENRMGQMLCYAGPRVAKFVKVFSKFGVVMGALK